MRPIMFHDIPHDRKGDIAHTQVVCEVRPTKADLNRTRVTIGGNTINYIGDCGSKTASLETVKLTVNSTLSTPDAEYMTMDLSTLLNNQLFVGSGWYVMNDEEAQEFGLQLWAEDDGSSIGSAELVLGWVEYEVIDKVGVISIYIWFCDTELQYQLYEDGE